MNLHQEVLSELKKLANKEKALLLARYFKTAPGEYGEGDIFWGITVPAQRTIVKRFSTKVDIHTVQSLLDSPIHEARLTGVLLLESCFKAALKKSKKSIVFVDEPAHWVALYLNNTHRINNWDLVDSSAPGVLGRWLEDKDRSVLYELAKSELLWENRIAMVATLYFIRKGEMVDVLKLSELFLGHSHDLIHKATGWMLREAWKRSPGPVEVFLKKYKAKMPRIMLRYAIEKMPPVQRQLMMAK